MSKIDNFLYPTPVPAKILIGGTFPFFGVDPSCCGVQRAKLLLQNSNLYDHDTSTLQTCRRTDNLLRAVKKTLQPELTRFTIASIQYSKMRVRSGLCPGSRCDPNPAGSWPGRPMAGPGQPRSAKCQELPVHLIFVPSNA